MNSFLKSIIITAMATFCCSGFNSAQAADDTKTVRLVVQKEQVNDDNTADVSLQPNIEVPGAHFDAAVATIGYYAKSIFNFSDYEAKYYLQPKDDEEDENYETSFGMEFPYEVRTIKWGRFLYEHSQSATGYTTLDYNQLDEADEENFPSTKKDFTIESGNGWGFMKDLINYLKSIITGNTVSASNAAAVTTFADVKADNHGINCLTLHNDGPNDVYLTHFEIEYYVPELALTLADLYVNDSVLGEGNYTLQTQHLGGFSGENIVLTVDKEGYIEIDQDQSVIRALGPTGTVLITATLYADEEHTVAIAHVTRSLVISDQADTKVYTLTFDPQNGGPTFTKSVIFGQTLPLVDLPKKTGCVFDGYWTGSDDMLDNWYNAGEQYYDSNVNPICNWNYSSDKTLYGHWSRATYYLHFNSLGGTYRSDRACNTDLDNVVLDVLYGRNTRHEIYNSNPSLAGYVFRGWTRKGALVYKQSNVHVISTTDGGLFDSNGCWIADSDNKDYEFSAFYEPKFDIVDYDEIVYRQLSGYEMDWDQKIYDEDVEASIDACYAENGNQQIAVLDFTKTNGEYIGSELMEIIEKKIAAGEVSENVLVYFNKDGYAHWSTYNYENAVQDGQCKKLTVHDKVPMKIKYPITTLKANYDRESTYNVSGESTTSQSVWGTVCLPFPMANYKYGVQFYTMTGYDDDMMYMESIDDENYVLPANTPAIYRRLSGQGSDISVAITETTDVPSNVDELSSLTTHLTGGYDLIGTIRKTIFYGPERTLTEAEKKAQNATTLETNNVYYFKQDAFTRIAINGKVTMYPFRAYFLDTNQASSNNAAKKIHLFVIDKDGFASDITDAILTGVDGGDGKIYDLQGRRVSKPVKGQLYMVNGKKKLYE